MSDMANNLGVEIGLDDEILAEESGYPILEPGDYPFTVLSFQRKRFNGSAKMSACTIVELSLQVQDVTIDHGLFLNTKMIGKLSEFFVAIGQASYGQKFRPNWQAVPGSSGMCKVGIRKWKGNDGVERESNTVTAFYPKSQQSSNASQPVQPSSWQQQRMEGYPTNASPWAPGKF